VGKKDSLQKREVLRELEKINCIGWSREKRSLSHELKSRAWQKKNQKPVDMKNLNLKGKRTG